MGINRSRRDRRDKFSLARITSDKSEAKTLETLVDQDFDLDLLHSLYDPVDQEMSEMTVVSDAVCFLLFLSRPL